MWQITRLRDSTRPLRTHRLGGSSRKPAHLDVLSHALCHDVGEVIHDGVSDETGQALDGRKVGDGSDFTRGVPN